MNSLVEGGRICGRLSLIVINTAHPDLKKIRAMVQKAIDKSEGKPTGAKKKKAVTQTGGSLGTRDGGYAANASEDLAAAC